MSGAVIVPDLSANPVEIKVLTQFIAVNAFAKSVIQCDGHSGLLKLQEQVGRELSLPAHVCPPYSHQTQGTVETFRKTLYVQMGSQSELDLQITWGSIQIRWIALFDMLHIRSTATSSSQMAEHHVRRCSTNLKNHPLLILECMFLLMLCHNHPCKHCRFDNHLKNHMHCG